MVLDKIKAGTDDMTTADIFRIADLGILNFSSVNYIIYN